MAMKSSADLDASYSLPMQYGGEVMVASTDSSGISRMRSMQSPTNKMVGVPDLNEFIACGTDLYVFMLILGEHTAFLLADPDEAFTCDLLVIDAAQGSNPRQSGLGKWATIETHRAQWSSLPVRKPCNSKSHNEACLNAAKC